MATVTPNTLERREYKYLVDEETVARIRRYIAGICIVDPYAEATGKYTIDTLYLDTPNLDIYRATYENSGDRYKLRIRGYPTAPGAPTFFEVKRRVGDTIIKTRAGVKGDWARYLRSDHPIDFDELPASTRKAVDNFVCHYHYQPMFPRTLVRYEREPYFSLVDEYARVTFDRSIACQVATELTLEPPHAHWMYLDAAAMQRGIAWTESCVLVELKFTSRVPGWMLQMVHTLDLPRLAFCKYTRAIEAQQIGTIRNAPDRTLARLR